MIGGILAAVNFVRANAFLLLREYRQEIIGELCSCRALFSLANNITGVAGLFLFKLPVSPGTIDIVYGRYQKNPAFGPLG